MQLADVNSPEALATIIAQNGLTNTIPVNATGTSLASQQEGFPEITMLPQSNGGEAPHGKDFNGFLKLLSSHVYHIQNGIPVSFNPAVSEAIGGYPNQAVLWHISESGLQLLQSTKDNNTDNFLTNPECIGSSWVSVLVTQSYVTEELNTKLDKNKLVYAPEGLPEEPVIGTYYFIPED